MLFIIFICALTIESVVTIIARYWPILNHIPGLTQIANRMTSSRKCGLVSNCERKFYLYLWYFDGADWVCCYDSVIFFMSESLFLSVDLFIVFLLGAVRSSVNFLSVSSYFVSSYVRFCRDSASYKAVYVAIDSFDEDVDLCVLIVDDYALFRLLKYVLGEREGVLVTLLRHSVHFHIRPGDLIFRRVRQ